MIFKDNLWIVIKMITSKTESFQKKASKSKMLKQQNWDAPKNKSSWYSGGDVQSPPTPYVCRWAIQFNLDGGAGVVFFTWFWGSETVNFLIIFLMEEGVFMFIYQNVIKISHQGCIYNLNNEKYRFVLM